MKKQEIDHKELREGPIEKRSCTDILCCLIFLAFLSAMVGLGYYGYLHGDPLAVIYPYDSEGNQCGRPDTATADYHYIYFVNPSYSTDETHWKVCVKSCPKSDLDPLDCYPNKWVTNCSVTANGTDYATYDSIEVMQRVCFPNNATAEFKEVLGNQEAMSTASDIIRCKWIILAVLGFAVGISILYLLFLRYFIAVFMWLVIFVIVVIVSLFGVYYNYNIYYSEKPINDDKTFYTYWGISIACYAFAVLFLVTMICMKKRINLAVAVMKSATIFIDDVWTVLLVPILLFIVFAAIIVLWVTALIYLYSTGELVKRDARHVIAEFEHDPNIIGALWFELLGIIWINGFKIALVQFVISFACCVWYFTADKDKLERPISRGFFNGLFYHLGSLALGSFVLSLVLLIKWFLSFMASVYQEAQSNTVVSWLCRCVLCFVECFTRFVKFLDTQAYIRIALTGEGFCSAAQNAYELVWENAGRFTALGGIGTVFNLLGKTVITCLSTYAGFAIITYESSFKGQITSEIGPTIIFALVSYVVSSLFMGVYEVSADAIIQSFIVDEKIHGENCSVFAPEPIKEFMKQTC